MNQDKNGSSSRHGLNMAKDQEQGRQDIAFKGDDSLEVSESLLSMKNELMKMADELVKREIRLAVQVAETMIASSDNAFDVSIDRMIKDAQKEVYSLAKKQSNDRRDVSGEEGITGHDVGGGDIH